MLTYCSKYEHDLLVNHLERKEKMTTSKKIKPLVEASNSIEVLIDQVIREELTLKERVKKLENAKADINKAIAVIKAQALSEGEAEMRIGAPSNLVPTTDHYTRPASWFLTQYEKKPDAKKNPQELADNINIVNILLEHGLHGERSASLFRKGKASEKFHWNS